MSLAVRHPVYINFRRIWFSSLSHNSTGSAQNLECCISSLNRTINASAKAGDLTSARTLFDQATHRDVVTWNTMMTAYAQHNSHYQVIRTFSDMQRSGMKPSPTSFSIIVSSCARLACLAQGQCAHGHLIRIGFLGNEFVGTSLINLYAECRMVDCMLSVFNEFNHESVASWNALISGYILNGQLQAARRVFDHMPFRNVISWTAMVNGYVGVKRIRDALVVFELMPTKNCVSWSVMLGGLVSNEYFEETVAFFCKMIQNHIPFSTDNIVMVIQACSAMGNSYQGKSFHCFVTKLGLNLNHDIEAALVTMYFNYLSPREVKSEFDKMNCKSVASWNSLIIGYADKELTDEARELFDKMPIKDGISWNCMINGYVKNNKIDDALKLLELMPEPNVKTYTILLKGFIKCQQISEARTLFNKMPQKDVVAYTAMIFGYMENNLVDDAIYLFSQMPMKNDITYNVMITGLVHQGKIEQAYNLFNECDICDSVSWNSLITGFVQNGSDNEAFLLFHRMISSGIAPTESALAGIFSSCANSAIIIHGKQVHGVAVKLGLKMSIMVSNSLINMYGKCGYMLSAKSVFDQMQEHDLVSWNSMINCYAINGFTKEAMGTFENMKLTATKPDSITFLTLLNACAHCFLSEDAENYFNSMIQEYGLQPDLAHYACIVDLLCRSGFVEKAERLIQSMPFKPDATVWTSLLCGCRFNDNVTLAEFATKRLITLDPRDPMPLFHLNEIYKSSGRMPESTRSKFYLNNMVFNKTPGYSWV